MQCFEYKIHGAVQGVGFRWATMSFANQKKITGFVRNNEDASVTIVACGDEWQINQLNTWLNEGGPSYSSIDNYDVEEIQLNNLPIGFTII